MSVPLRRLEQPLIIEIERRKVRGLYKWLSKITGLETCWVEGTDDLAHPVWAFIKRIGNNLCVLRSKHLIAGTMLLAIPYMASAQTSVNLDSAAVGTPHGFTINSTNLNSVATGDINGDGIEDMILGATSEHAGGTRRGQVRVIFGNSTFSSSLDVSSLDGSNGFIVNGVNNLDRIGDDVSSGDINGDGFDDVLIGAYSVSVDDGMGGTLTEAGKVYVIYGKSAAFTSSIDLSSLNGTNGFTVSSVLASDYLGAGVTSGDINGDGMDDLAISTGGYSAEKGNVFVLFGNSSFASAISTSSINGTNGFVLIEDDQYDYMGVSITAGDINGDGIADIIVSAPKADITSTNEGKVHVVFGKTTSFASSIDITSVQDGSTGFVINGVSNGDQIGDEVSFGDVNGDGNNDIIIGARRVDQSRGATYVVFGSSSFTSSLNLSSLNGANGFVLKGTSASDFSGSSAFSADMNKDGVDDILIGANGYEDSGGAYVVYGSSSFNSSLELSSLDGTNGFVLSSSNNTNLTIGRQLTAGDINGDGRPDVIANAPGGNRTYVFTRPILNQSITGNEGFRMLSSPGNGTLYDELLADFWTQGLTGGDTDSGTDNLYVWDGESQAWSGLSNLNTRNLSGGHGFLMYIFSDDSGPDIAGDAGFPKNLTTLNFDSDVSFNSGTVNAASGINDGSFILAGNPYLFPIDWDELTKTNLSNTVYVFDDANSVFQSWNGSVGNVANGEIGTFQGFFIEGSGGSGSLTIEPADTVSTSVSLLKRADPEPKALKVHAEAGGLKTDAWLSFQEGGEISRDDFDGLALTPLSATYLRLATVIDTEETLSINALPIDQADEVIFPLEVSGVLNEHVATLSFEGLDKFEDWSIVIRDNETEEEYPLEEGKSIELEIDKASAKAITQPKLPTPIEVKAKTSSIRYQLIMKPGVSVHTEQPRPNLPEHILLEQNYPNPFNPNTRILFEVPRAGLVTLEVFNLLGQKVAELVNEQKAIGRYEVNFNASSLSSGVYVYKLNTGGQQLTRKMTLIK